MAKYIIKRILWLIPICLGVIFIVFMIMQLAPGDPVYAILGSTASPEAYEAKRHELGLDRSVLYQFGVYLKNIITRFDFGTSYADGRSVAGIIMDRFPITLRLGILGIIVPVLIGIPLGIIAAIKQGRIADRIISVISLVFASMPDFWYSLILMLLFAGALHIFPASYNGTAISWVMPVIAVSGGAVAMLTRMTRSSMLDVVRQDYIRTSRAKGLSEVVIVFKHALKNALIPVLTTLGVQMGNVMAGSIVVEQLFNIPGMGTMMYGAIANQNYPVVRGAAAFLAIFICGINLIIDVLYAFVDPRIKAQYVSGKKKKKTPEKEKAVEKAA